MTERKRTGEASMRQIPCVLMVGPGPNVRGGINSVISAYQQSTMWRRYSCKWLSTYDDRSPVHKIIAALRAYLLCPILIGRADIVHIHGVFRKSFIRKLPLILMAKAMRKRVIFHIHAATFEGAFDGAVGPVIRWTLSSVDQVIALSPSWAAGIQTRCPGANITYIPNPVATLPEDRARYSEKKEPRILFLGKLEPRKGFTDLLMAMPAVLAVVPTAKLVFAGDGDIEGARLIASKLDISPSVSFLGFVRGECKAVELQHAAVLCLPSYNEGVPVAILEAMSNGIPVVATPVGGIPDLICSGKNGVLVSPGDIGGIARAITDLLTDPHLAASIGTAGCVHVERFHRVDYVCSLLQGVYMTLSSGRTAESDPAMKN